MNFLFVFLGVIVVGLLLFSILKKYIDTKFNLPYIFLLGSFVSIPLLYYIRTYLASSLFNAVCIWLFIILLIGLIKWKNIKGSFSINTKHLILFLILSGASFVVFNKSFSHESSNFLIATNMYLDMGAHIPYIRSFSSDVNFPFQIPFYASSKIPYHFMFNFFTGILEYSGLRLDVAYNLLSSLTFASLYFIFLDFGNIIFKKRFVGFLAFFLFFSPFNFSFFSLINTNILNIWRNQQYNFSSFLGENTVGNFLYINTYLNQRHLLFSLAVSLIFILVTYVLVQKNVVNKLWIIFGAILSLMYLWNVSIFVILILVLTCFLAINRRKKELLFWFMPVLIFGFVQAFPFMNSTDSIIKFSPGYLIHSYFSIPRFIAFWLLNLGASILTITGGFIVSNKFQKKLFIAVILVFVLPNVFQFTQDMFDNHKFFNFWYMIMCFYSAFLLVTIFKKKLQFKIIVFILVILSVITSISNLSVIKNDIYAKIPDYGTYPLIQFAKTTINPQDIVVTNGEIYDPLSIGGLRTYLGRSHYIFLYGGNPQERIIVKQGIFQASLSATLKEYVNKSDVKYIIVYKDLSVKNILQVNESTIDKTFKKIYEDDFGTIYKI